MTTLAYIIWCGVVWVLRGGLLGALVRGTLGVEPGTTVTRIVCAGLMAAPLAFVVGWWALALWASIYVAMTLGYFDKSMGLQEPGRDHAFLALWGATVAAVATAPLWGRLSLFNDPASVVLAIDLAVLAWASVGALAVVAYASQKPLGRRWNTDWTERAEFLTGCAMGVALFGATLA